MSRRSPVRGAAFRARRPFTATAHEAHRVSGFGLVDERFVKAPFVSPTPDLRAEFDALADEWHGHTDHFSVTWRQAMDPAYQQIIGMGHLAVPFILARLRSEGPSWLWALRAIARCDPAEGNKDWDSAVAQWEHWARDRRLI